MCLSLACAATRSDCLRRSRDKLKHEWALTFDMSGGAKGAQRLLGRPLDGGLGATVRIAGVVFSDIALDRPRRSCDFNCSA